MAKRYYVHTIAQANGDHEVHEEPCQYLPAPGNRKYLGEFNNCEEAVKEARNYYRQVNGFKYCSNPCHTQ